MKRGAMAALAALVVVLGWSSSALASVAPRLSVAAARGIQELMGSGDGSPVAWAPRIGLWGGTSSPHWWQSALALTTLVRYAERTDDRSPAIQNVLVRTYQLNHYQPVQDTARNFTNQFMDDTGWWGLAWVAASQYELYDRHDEPDAARFLAVAEDDAAYIAAQPRPCGGIEWSPTVAPDTTTDAEFVNLTAQLASYRQAAGPFHDPEQASTWLADARGVLTWLEGSGLVKLTEGRARDFMSSRNCRVFGYPITHTQGEIADALVHMGQALHAPSYYRQAAGFLRFAISARSGLMAGGVLRDHCQARAVNCSGFGSQLAVTSSKGIFMLAMADWVQATGSTQFRRFIETQGEAIVHHDILGARRGAPGCRSAHRCQFGLSWAGRVPWMLVTVGTQESALDALIAAIR